jgi:nucleoside-diphosphate-sugar epimerase
MSKTVFVTGSKGLVGSHLLPKLIEYGYEVETDLRYLYTQTYAAVIHLAARTNVHTVFDPDIYGTNIVLAKEVLSTPNRTIFASSCSSRHLTNPYAYSKRYGEHLCQLHGNALALRFFNIYGEGAMRGIVKFLCDQPNNAKITIRGESLIRDYIEVEDVVMEVIKNISPTKEVRVPVFCKGGGCRPVMKPRLIPNVGVIDVGTGVGTSTKSLVDLYMELSGKRFEIQTIPADSSEPRSMISENIVPHVDLKTGLLKLIKNETV